MREGEEVLVCEGVSVRGSVLVCEMECVSVLVRERGRVRVSV